MPVEDIERVLEDVTKDSSQGPADQSPSVSMGARHRRVGIICLGMAVGMLGMAYAAVPLYRMFCQVTGFGGTTQVASAPAEKVLAQTITMRFDANVSRDLPWAFQPVEHTMEVHLGETKLASYRATNTSDHPVTGTAVFNVTPESAGQFFNKLECFCFTEQRLEPGQSVDMPVSFFVDPEIVNDADAGRLSEITLSYTFYPVKNPSQSAQAPKETPAQGG
ncbi:Cytochrome c oxidase assembly protein CtaG [Candidatus Filomicrobium marinum]|nr:Cytochrome c oxidase assembly protein CtaG [Candidatus Filomicrobium marinum]